jgi:hypothetical protein
MYVKLSNLGQATAVPSASVLETIGPRLQFFLQSPAWLLEPSSGWLSETTWMCLKGIYVGGWGLVVLLATRLLRSH